MSDTSLVFNLVARDRTEGGLSSARERFDTAAAGIGAGVAAALGAGLVQNIDATAANAKLAAQLSLGPAEAASVAKVSASVYRDAWGDSLETVNLAVKGVYQNIGDVSTAEGGLEGVTRKVTALAETLDQDLTMATAAAGQMVRTGLADNVDEALDILTAGLGTAADKSGDLLETFNEYSTQFRRLGIDGQTATGLIAQGLKGGARDADQVADALGQFGERALAGGSAVDAAYKSIGLSASDMAKKIGAGGTSAEQALATTLNALRGTKDEQVRLNAAAALFGDPANVMGDALYALNPATAAAASGMDKSAGSADRLMKTMGGSASKSLERFKREAMGKLADVTGGFVQFAMDNRGVFEPLAYTLAGLAATVLVVKAAMITYTAIASVVSGAHALMTSSTWGVIGGWLRMNAVGLGVYARIAAGAAMSGLATAAAWTGSALVSIGTWSMAVLRAGATAAVQYTMMAARAVVWAATMAAQWLIAMGPIGWVIAAVIALVAVVVANWDTVKKWTLAAWNWVVARLVWARDFMVRAFLNWTLIGLIIKHWDGIKSATVSRAMALVAWVRGLPGRISGALGNLGSLLVGKGKAVVQGLWSGISSMGGWIKSKILGWAKNVIPGPVAKALGIASPSKVTTAQGRWIARGLVVGLTGSTAQVRAASTKLADIVRDALAPGKKRSKALATVSTGTSQLARLATQEGALATKLKTASTRLADLIKERDKLAADVKKGILDAANITQDTGGVTTADTILTGLQNKLAAAVAFTANLAQLRKKGIRSDLVEQIAQAGVEGGTATAAALAMADKSTIAQINSTQGQLVSAATTAGAVTADAMYGAGIDAANGLIKGLKAKQAAIDAQMLAIARSMSASIKKALGIRSPSRLFADEVGQYIPPGVVAGMARTTPQLDTALRTLVQPQLAAPQRPLTAPGMAPVLGAGAAGGVVLVRFLFEGADGDFKRMVRKTVRVDGRGNVQTAFGR
ncbi:phage tail tape measure protein [Streptomyces acidiscabies]|uniref:Phage tail tape measure protein n=1 Tax=Streptomyces acidiscabies TaxID=42234 RepID=A0ABU4M8M0_9ACTN|nr:phage tail tape measure protein [Streptomyces acidiscabies]MDX3024076.1 phage tail tape measure protein [Streptomyces acidiscabies]